jgi:hypothetical protein
MKGYKNNPNSKQLRPSAPAQKPEDAKAELLRLRNEIVQLIEKDPAKAASLLTQWLQLPAKTPVNPRKKAA